MIISNSNKLSQLKDQDLMSLLERDNHDAFTEIYDRYWKKMFALAADKLDDLDEAKEIVQQIFVSLWERRHTIDIHQSLSGYIAVSVKYKVINILHRRDVRQKHLDELPSDFNVDDSTLEWLEFEELRHRIAKIVTNLPEKCRLVFVMSREEGLSQKKIAKKLGLSEKTVEAHLGKAIKTLKSGLKSFFLTLL